MNTKLPASVLEARGSFKKNPKRRRIDLEATGEVGNAPAYFLKNQRDIWKELKSILPKGLAKSPDKWMLELAVTYMDKFREDGLKPQELAALLKILGNLGLSPRDRAQLAQPVNKVSKDSNEFAEFT
jgi:phage terminase small subunit